MSTVLVFACAAAGASTMHATPAQAAILLRPITELLSRTHPFPGPGPLRRGTLVRGGRPLQATHDGPPSRPARCVDHRARSDQRIARRLRAITRRTSRRVTKFGPVGTSC